MRSTCLIALLILLNGQLPAVDNPFYHFYVEPEFMIGKNVPLYESFPESVFRKNYSLSFGLVFKDTVRNWVSYYHYPSLGISMIYSDLGNPEVFRSEFSLIPYMLLRTSSDPRRSVDFKIGMGGSYASSPYDAETNPENLVIGSKFNWGFQLFLYKNLLVRKGLILKTGLGYQHTSNAHTALPNYGLNSVLLSLSTQFTTGHYDPMFAARQSRLPIDRTRHYFLQSRFGMGWHELGGTVDPIGGPSYNVYSYSFSGGILFKQQFKLSAGLTYRFYESYYRYIMDTPDRKYGTDPNLFGHRPKWEASNVNLFIEAEFLVGGHLGFDIQGGFNFHKPFYKEYNERWEFKKGFEYWRSRYLATHIGLNYYLFNTSRLPKHNVKFGAHINANFGEADFMNLSVGYLYLVR